MEAFQHLGICRLSERIRELEREIEVKTRGNYTYLINPYRIDKTREIASNGATVTRYKLAR